MIRKKSETKQVINTNMRGGKGDIVLNHLLNADEFYGKGRLFSEIIVQPSDSIGVHVHEGEMEVYYISSGKGLYHDNGTDYHVIAGDTTLTLDGESHGIVNTGDEPLVIVALIIYK